MIRLTIVLIALLSGCASSQTKQQSVATWMTTNYQLVENGTLKRSDFYKQLFNKLLENPGTRNNTSMLSSTNMMIDASLQFEAGSMNAEQYNAKKREAYIMMTQTPPRESTSSSSSDLDYLILQPNEINCQSYSLGTDRYTKCK